MVVMVVYMYNTVTVWGRRVVMVGLWGRRVVMVGLWGRRVVVMLVGLWGRRMVVMLLVMLVMGYVMCHVSTLGRMLCLVVLLIGTNLHTERLNYKRFISKYH
jgi:hypothetical protein